MTGQTLDSFAHRCAAQTSLGGLWQDALAFYAERRIDKVSYHTDDPNAPGATAAGISVSGFPDDWVLRYVTEGLALVDPIPALTLTQPKPFRWSEAASLARLTDPQRAFLADLAASGVGEGLAMQACGPNLRNAYVGLGFADADVDIDAQGIFELQCAVHVSHLRYCELTSDRLQPAPELSPRESEVLKWIAQGKSNSVIADILGLSPHTIDTMTRRLFDKLQVNDRTSAAIRGIGVGLLRYDGAGGV